MNLKIFFSVALVICATITNQISAMDDGSKPYNALKPTDPINVRLDIGSGRAVYYDSPCGNNSGRSNGYHVTPPVGSPSDQIVRTNSNEFFPGNPR